MPIGVLEFLAVLVAFVVFDRLLRSARNIIIRTDSQPIPLVLAESRARAAALQYAHDNAFGLRRSESPLARQNPHSRAGEAERPAVILTHALCFESFPGTGFKQLGRHWNTLIDASKPVRSKIFHPKSFCRCV